VSLAVSGIASGFDFVGGTQDVCIGHLHDVLFFYLCALFRPKGRLEVLSVTDVGWIQELAARVKKRQAQEVKKPKEKGGRKTQDEVLTELRAGRRQRSKPAITLGERTHERENFLNGYRSIRVPKAGRPGKWVLCLDNIPMLQQAEASFIVIVEGVQKGAKLETAWTRPALGPKLHTSLSRMRERSRNGILHYSKLPPSLRKRVEAIKVVV